ncbi:MAG: triphosphoribosyl-dephospho-CoA synthase [Planctomycetota bacterium]
MNIGQLATLACLVEVTVPKPGNVHRSADFEDVTFLDFAASAVAIAEPMERASEAGVGKTVLDAIHATQQVVATNTNLGIVLLFAPLAVAADKRSELQAATAAILENMTTKDAEFVYEAIRIAKPGGLGTTKEADVNDDPPASLVEAMRLAEDRDMIARQYANGCADVFESVLPSLLAGIQGGLSVTDAVIRTHVETMARYPDSLIRRKLGDALANESATRAAAVLESGKPGESAYHEALADFDFWLRSDGHRRNPGTTADLIAAALFAGLLDGSIEWPLRY